MDAEVLYPSLNLEDILQGIWDLVLHGEARLNNLDIKEVAKYIAIVYTKDELRRHKVIV